jgi:hypothetical protein
MKTIVNAYALAAAVLAVATFSVLAASSKAGPHQQSAIAAVAYDCCDNPTPCGLPGMPTCPDGSPIGSGAAAPTN